MGERVLAVQPNARTRDPFANHEASPGNPPHLKLVKKVSRLGCASSAPYRIRPAHASMGHEDGPSRSPKGKVRIQQEAISNHTRTHTTRMAACYWMQPCFSVSRIGKSSELMSGYGCQGDCVSTYRQGSPIIIIIIVNAEDRITV